MSTSRPPNSDAAALASMVPVPAERDMPPGRQQVLLEYLVKEVSEPSSPVTRRSHRFLGRGPWRMRLSRPVLVAGAAVATASAVAVATVLINAPSSRSPVVQPPQAACAIPYENGRVPFLDGHRTTLARAQSEVGFPIPVPHSAPASRHALSGIWVSQDSQLVALVYGKEKLKILLQRWPTTTNPITHKPGEWFRYERSIMTRNSAAIGQVNGDPALIVRPRVAPCHNTPALVEFYRRGLEIDVFSPGYSTAELHAVAQSIH